MNFATGIRIKIGVEDNDAVANNQKTMERNPFIVGRGFATNLATNFGRFEAISSPCEC
jgi:hypothetical protein